MVIFSVENTQLGVTVRLKEVELVKVDAAEIVAVIFILYVPCWVLLFVYHATTFVLGVKVMKDVDKPCVIGVTENE